MSESSGSKVGFFLAGIGIGAVIALLFAPKSGEETRKYIADKAEEGKDYLTSKSREVREQAEELVDKSKEWVEKGKDRLAGAVEAGKQAYKTRTAG